MKPRNIADDDSQWTDNPNGKWNLSYTGGTGNDLTLTLIPESSSALLGSLGLMALLRRRR